MMNDLWNDNDMKCHDRMTYDDFCACSTCGSGCCLLTPPHPQPMLPGCDGRYSFTAFYPFRTACTCMKLYKTYLRPLLTYRNILRPPILSFLGLFSLFFAPEMYPAKWRDCLWSGTHNLRAVCPLPQPVSPAFRYISAATDHSRGVWPIPLMPPSTTYMNYTCLNYADVKMASLTWQIFFCIFSAVQQYLWNFTMWVLTYILIRLQKSYLLLSIFELHFAALSYLPYSIIFMLLWNLYCTNLHSEHCCCYY